jgi:hypothetical protein
MGGAPFPWCETPQFVQSYGRLASLLKSDVVALDLGSYFEDWVGRHPAAITGLPPARRVTQALRHLLALPEARGTFVETAQAIRHSRKEAIALVLPPFDEWIPDASRLAGGVVEHAEVDEDAIDDIAVAVADFTRILSGIGIDALLVNETPRAHLSAERLELYSPLSNLAKHYQWDIGLRFCDARTLETGATGFDFLITRWPSGAAGVCGLELSDEFWAGGGTIPQRGLVYVEVPADASPEDVLAKLALLR